MDMVIQLCDAWNPKAMLPKRRQCVAIYNFAAFKGALFSPYGNIEFCHRIILEIKRELYESKPVALVKAGASSGIGRTTF